MKILGKNVTVRTLKKRLPKYWYRIRKYRYELMAPRFNPPRINAESRTRFLLLCLNRIAKGQRPGIRTRIRRARAFQNPLQGGVSEARLTLESFNGGYRVKKDFSGCKNPEALVQANVAAFGVLSEYSWCLPIIDHGPTWVLMPFLPPETRLDRVAQVALPAERRRVAALTLSVVLDLYVNRIIHGDIISRNLFYVQGRILLGDFDHAIIGYPKVPLTTPIGDIPFRECRDLTGLGWPDMGWGNQAGFASDRPDSPSAVLRVPIDQACTWLEHLLRVELHKASTDFQTGNGRMAGTHFYNSYQSFSLPKFSVPRKNARRDTAKRLARFGLTDERIRGRRVLDLGSYTGGILFELQKYAPSYCLGIEYDPEKVRMARRLAAFGEANNIEFRQGNVDELEPSELGGPYDVVFCLSLLEHLQNPERLFPLLASVTARTLCFEGNPWTNRVEVEAKLKSAGFEKIRFAGVCDDDAITENNRRPMWVAER